MFRISSKFILLFTIITFPIGFGGNRPLIWSSYATISAFAFLLITFSDKGKHLDEIPRLLVLMGFLTLVWMVIPSAMSIVYVDLPGSSVPEHAQGVPSGPHAIEAYAGIDEVIHLGLFSCCFAVSFALARERSTRVIILGTTLVAGIGYAAYGLAIFFGFMPQPIWLEAYGQYNRSLRSTFPNRNSYATFCNLAILTCCWWAVRDYIHWSGKSLHDNWLPKATSYFNRTSFYIIAMVFVLLVSASLQTHSRGGALSLTVAFIVFIILALKPHKTFGATVVGVVAVALIVTFSIGMSGDRLFDRFDLLARLGAEEGRREGWAATLNAIQVHWLWGTGAGTFDAAFEAYRPYGFSGRFGLAHNSYLESFLELGVPGALLLLACYALLLVISISGLSSSATLPYAALGVSATILVALHSLVDFSMQIPAVSVSYGVIMGAVTSTCVQHRKRSSDAS